MVLLIARVFGAGASGTGKVATLLSPGLALGVSPGRADGAGAGEAAGAGVGAARLLGGLSPRGTEPREMPGPATAGAEADDAVPGPDGLVDGGDEPFPDAPVLAAADPDEAESPLLGAELAGRLVAGADVRPAVAPADDELDEVEVEVTAAAAAELDELSATSGRDSTSATWSAWLRSDCGSGA